MKSNFYPGVLGLWDDIYFFNQKLQPSEVGPFCLFLPIFALLWRAVSLIGDIKNLNTCLKSAKFKTSEKYKLEYFGQVEKIFTFFFFIFHLHFRILWKFLKASILPLRIIFSARYYFWLYFFSFKRNWPKCADCQNFWNKL